MASARNDRLQTRSVEGTVNYYDDHKGVGTHIDKGLAARLGGHCYNPINNIERDEVYFRELRHKDHFVNDKMQHTRHAFGARRRKFQIDERNHVRNGLTMPSEHPREADKEHRRTQLNLSQIENHQSYAGFQDRCQQVLVAPPAKTHHIHNRLYANEVEKLRPKQSSKQEWLSRRGEPMLRSTSCPSLELKDPCGSLQKAVHMDARKEATQKQTESAHFAPWMSAHTYANSMESTPAGRHLASTQQHCSVHRLENHDFAVSRKNNHFSSQDKLTRADPFYMRPKLTHTNSSVKYDIVSNERKWFKYSA